MKVGPIGSPSESDGSANDRLRAPVFELHSCPVQRPQVESEYVIVAGMIMALCGSVLEDEVLRLEASDLVLTHRREFYAAS